MFYHIEGVVAQLEPGLAVLDCGGVGFALYVTNGTLAALRAGDRAKLFVYTYIREGIFDLYGFMTMNEKRSFEMLIAVSGVGPKAALSILSSGTPETLAMAIVTGDEKALTVAPGIGKKIAQRVILELKDKITKDSKEIAFAGADIRLSVSAGKWGEAAMALGVLGYTNADISRALKDIDETLSLEEIIKAALRTMVK